MIREEPGNETITIEDTPFIGSLEHIDKINESDSQANIDTEYVDLESVDYEDNVEHTDKEDESKLVSNDGREHINDFLYSNSANARSS